MSLSNQTSGTGGGGSGDDSTTDDSTSDDSGGGGGGDGGGGRFTLPSTLSTFADNPQNFILGAVLAGAVEWLFGLVTLALDTILLILAGSEPTRFNAPNETLGIADVPVAIADSIGGAGDTVGSGIIAGIESFNEPIFTATAFAGPLSPIIVTAVVALETVVVLWLAQRAVYVAADLLQLGGLTE